MLNKARITFKKPDINFKIRGYTAYDMHAHTTYSDGQRTTDQMLENAGKKGIRLCITDHNDIRGAVEAHAKNQNTIPGIELTASEGMHLLMYFYNVKELEEYYGKYVKKHRNKHHISFLDKSAIDLIDDSKYYNCLVSAAHPFAISWTGLLKHTSQELDKKILRKIECIEVINGSATKGMNKKAINFALETDKCFTGGSDAHIRREIGSVISYTREQNTPEQFLESILKKNNFIIGTQSPFLSKATSHCLKLHNKSRAPNTEYLKHFFKFFKQQNSAHLSKWLRGICCAQEPPDGRNSECQEQHDRWFLTKQKIDPHKEKLSKLSKLNDVKIKVEFSKDDK